MDPDRALALAREHGCQPPVYGRHDHLGLWNFWAYRIARIAARGDVDVATKARRIADADRYAGHDGEPAAAIEAMTRAIVSKESGTDVLASIEAALQGAEA